MAVTTGPKLRIAKKPGGGYTVDYGAGLAGSAVVMNDGELSKLLTQLRSSGQLTEDDIAGGLKDADLGFSMGAAGVSVGQNNSGGAAAAGSPTASTPPTGGGLTVTPGGGGSAPGYSLGGGGAGGGAASGGGGGGGGGYYSRGGDTGWGGGSGAAPGITASGTLPAAPGSTAAGIDFTKPLPFKIPSGPTTVVPGSNPSTFSYPRQPGIFEGLPSNPSLGDVVGNFAQKQDAAFQAALGALGQGRGELDTDPLRTAFKGRVQSMLSNPFSLDEATVQRIMGANTDAIAQRGGRLEGLANDVAASRGMLRSGGAADSVARIREGTANQVSEAERQTRIQQALQNQADVRSAIGAAQPAVSEDANAKAGYNMAAANTLASTKPLADAFLLPYILGQGNAPNVNLWTGGRGAGNLGYGSVGTM